jgi:hypothetical protein
MTASQRNEELLPLGLMNPLGAWGYIPYSQGSAGPRREVPKIEESCRRPDATYAFRGAEGEEWRVSGGGDRVDRGG